MDPRIFKEVRPFSVLPASLAQAANIDFITINRLVTACPTILTIIQMSLKRFEISEQQQNSMQQSEEYDVMESYEKRYPNNQSPNELLRKEAEARKERILKVQEEVDAKY